MRNNNIFSNPLYASETSKNWPGANKKKIFKNICEIILNTPNVPDGKVPGCTADTSPRAKYCTFLEGAAEQKGIIEAIDKPPHTTASPSLTAPRGRAATGTRPQRGLGSIVKPLREAGGDQPPLPSRQGALKIRKKIHKTRHTHISQGLCNELGIKKPG